MISRAVRSAEPQRRQFRESFATHREIRHIAFGADGEIAQMIGGGERGGAAGERVVNNADPQRQRRAHDLTQETLGLERRMRRDLTFGAARRRTGDDVLEGLLAGDAAQTARCPTCASSRRPCHRKAF